MNGQNFNMNPPMQVTAQQFAAKFNSKREVYRFVAVDCGAYVSSMETMTVWHLRDLASKKRTMIKAKDISHIEVPQFEGLAIEQILDFAKSWRDGAIMMYLPAVHHEIL